MLAPRPPQLWCLQTSSTSDWILKKKKKKKKFKKIYFLLLIDSPLPPPPKKKKNYCLLSPHIFPSLHLTLRSLLNLVKNVHQSRGHVNHLPALSPDVVCPFEQQYEKSSVH